MRSLWIASWVLLSCSLPLAAGTFAGIEPGVSTKADVERALGPPLAQVGPAAFTHDPTAYAAKAIRVDYRTDSDVVEVITVEMAEGHPKSTYREWFKLGEPDSVGQTPYGNRIEFYTTQHLMLVFAGQDATQLVMAFSHVDPAMAQEIPTMIAPRELEAYFGVLTSSHRGQGVLIEGVNPGSPAERAGLRPGDVILEFGGAPFYRSGVESSELAVLMAARPPGRPVQVLFQRGTQRFQCQIVPEAMERAAINAIRREIFLTNFQQGEALWRAGKCEQAIPFLHRATTYNHRDSQGWMILGYCFLQGGRNSEALYAYAEALRLLPDSPAAKYSVAFCHDRLGNRPQAAAYYEAYLSAHDQNRQRIKHAKKRLRSISSRDQQAVDWDRLLVDIAGAVQGELSDPDPDR